MADLLSSSPGLAVMLTGPAGVGKTRLGTECLALAARRGFATARVLATRAASSLPLGAFAPLLPAHEGRPDAADLLGWARRAVTALAPGASLALLVDDAHLLDDASATLTFQLASSSDTFVVTTVRSGEPAPDAVTALWKDDLAVRIELGELDDAAVNALVATAVGAPVEDTATQRLRERSAGNPLYLRELMLAAVGSGALRHDREIWKLTGDLAVSTRLAELIDARLGTLTTAERNVLELIAHGEPLGAATIQVRYRDLTLDALEQRGLLVMDRDGRRLTVRLAHPLYGEVLRRHIPSQRAREVSRLLAGAVERTGARRREDLLRLAIWRLDGGGALDGRRMLLAAQAARNRGDLLLAERLARAATEAGAGFDAGLLASQLSFLLGRGEQAEQGFAGLAAQAVTDAQRVILATSRIENLLVGLGRPRHALEVAAGTEAVVSDDECRRAMTVQRAELLYISGDVPRALGVLEPVLTSAHGRLLVSLAPTAAMCLALTGRLGEAITLTEEGLAAQLTLTGPPMTFGPYLHLIVQGVALGHAGRLIEAEELAAGEYRRALAEHSFEAQAAFAQLLSWVLMLRGQVAEATRCATTAATFYRERGWGAFLRFALANLAHTQALSGATEAAKTALHELDGLGIPASDVSGSLIVQARAWTEVAEGHLTAGKRLLEEAAALARAGGDAVGEVAALHDLVRVGRGAQVAGRLVVLASVVEGDLVRARGAMAVAIGSGDAEGLQAASASFEAMGAPIFAAEAATAAAVALRRAGDNRRAAAAERRAAALVGRCPGVSTPMLGGIESQAMLTPRELEVARLAAAGLSNREIAARLSVSVRTVETQLQRTYEKLGVRRRADLQGALIS